MLKKKFNVIYFFVALQLCTILCAGDFDNFDFDFDFSAAPIETTTTSEPSSAPPITITDNDLSGLNDFNDIDFGTPESTAPETTQTAAPTPPTEFGIPFTIPYIGTVSLIPFTDEKTQKLGYKAKFADKTKNIKVGELVIDEGTISLIDGKFGLTGRATLFGKQAEFGLKEASLADKRALKKAVLGVTYIQKPTIEILPGKSITLNSTDIVLEKDKPLTVLASTTLFSKTIGIGFVFTKKSAGAFLNLPANTLLKEVISGISDTPLGQGSIQEAKLLINNIVTKKVAAKDVKASDDAKLQAVLTGIVNLSNSGLAENDPSLDSLSIKADISSKGAIASISANQFPLKNIGIINGATIAIDTVSTPKKITLAGDLGFSVSELGQLVVKVNSTITNKGIEFSGSIPQEFNYAGFSLKNFQASYDTLQKASKLIGDISIEGLSLQATLTLLPDAQNPTQRTIKFSAQGKSPSFDPFKNSGIPVINTFKITNFDSAVTIEKKNNKTINTLTLAGDVHMLGQSLKSIVRFVSNEKGEKGVYMNAPLSKGQRLSDFFPALKGPIFDGIMFEQASFSASTIDFFDEQSKVQIKKGLSFLAAVPLAGSLAQAGKLMGASNQTFTMYGTIIPENVLLSEFGIVLSKGEVNPTSKFSMGEIAVALTGKPSLNVLANMFFRPDPQNVFEFTGKFSFGDIAANFSAILDGSWKNAFGLNGWELTNPSLMLGLVYGSPGVPTEIGGTANLIVRPAKFNPQDPPFLDLSIAFIADAALKNMAFEGKSNRSVSYAQAVQFVIDYFLSAAFNTSLPNFAQFAPDVAYYDLYVKYATMDTKIGSKIIQQGIAAAGKTDILGQTAEIDFKLDSSGLKAYGGLNPVNIHDVLKLSGRGEKKKPEIDIELTLARQIFRITGILELATLYKLETFVELSNKGFEFNFESALGGGDFMWEGKPLLMGKVHGVSSGSFSNPNFSIEIAFQQYLKKFILAQVDVGFAIAKEAVERDLKAARTEIDKIDSVIAKADNDIKNARDIVARAQRDLDSISRAKATARADIEKAQRAVDSLKTEENNLDAWFSSLPKV